MTLRKCSCGRINTTKNSRFIGEQETREDRMLLFNCASCGTTFGIINKEVENGRSEKTKPLHEAKHYSGAS